MLSEFWRRSAALLALGLTTTLLRAGPATAQAGEGPGPEEMAAFGAPRAVAAAPAMESTHRGAPIGLSREVLESAAAYRLYMRQAAAVSADFGDGVSVAEALKVGAAYEPRQLTGGAVAFAAVAAMQDADFAQAVRTLGADAAERPALIEKLLASPQSAARLPHADAAAGRIIAALALEGGQVRAAGLRVKQAAYDIQKQAWSKSEVNARVERLALAKTLSAQRLSPPVTDLAELQLASLGAGSLELPEGAPEAADRPVVARGLALAALAVLGEAEPARAEALMDDRDCNSCLRMSKLNLFQCLAVAKPWYEDVFCLGQHVLIDTGDCIETAARMRPVAAPTSVTAPLGAPVPTVAALAVADGPGGAP